MSQLKVDIVSIAAASHRLSRVGALATWDDADGMVAWITTQRPHIDRLAMSDVLDIPTEKLRVIAPRDQGGAFGVKAPFYREPILSATWHAS